MRALLSSVCASNIFRSSILIRTLYFCRVKELKPFYSTMPARKRATDADAASEPVAKRRSSRQAAAKASDATLNKTKPEPVENSLLKKEPASRKRKSIKEEADIKQTVSAPKVKAGAKPSADKKLSAESPDAKPSKKSKSIKSEDDGDDPTAPSGAMKSAKKATAKTKKPVKEEEEEEEEEEEKGSDEGIAKKDSRASSEEMDVDSIPTTNPDAPKHDGEWYWLMKAEPETRLENGIDVRFSIDDLRAKKKPEGWDGIRAYAARNHMRNMNAGDKAFFYHSNCKEPAIVGIMEIVKEFSEDKTARQPGTPYYDPKSTRENPRWSLVHVEFRKKFAVPIDLKELRSLGQSGGPLAEMQMLKQSRLSVSRVSGDEWKALCAIADKKAEEAGLKHQTGPPPGK